MDALSGEKQARVSDWAGVDPALLPRTNRDWLWAILLIIAVILSYLPVWHAGYIWDDDAHLMANPCIVGPLGLKEIWTPAPGHFFPLVMTTFWFEHALWGLEPGPYHVVNVLQHAASAVVLWRVLLILRISGAWFGAALWALHPLQVESVAWISEMKNTQSCFFYLLTIFFFIRWLRAGGLKWNEGNYGLTLFFAVLAMASKSTTVVLPAVLGLCAWWVEGCWHWRRLLPLIPVALMSVISTAVTIWSPAPALPGMPAAAPPSMANWPERLATVGDAFWFYLGKLLWPHPLMAIYPRWQIDATQGSSYLPLLAVILTFVVLWCGRNSQLRPFFFAFAYYLVVIAPFLGLLHQSFWQLSQVEDHLQYLAGISLFALVGAGLTRWAKLIGISTRVMPALGGGLLLVLGTLSWQRTWVYESQETLWNDAVAQNPQCWIGYANLGSALVINDRVDEAIADFRQALLLHPHYVDANLNLGGALILKGKTKEAMVAYQRALEIDPNSVMALTDVGHLLLTQGKIEEGLTSIRKALALNPSNTAAHTYLAEGLMQKGQIESALAEYQWVLNIDASNAPAHFGLGLALARTGRLDEAIDELQKGLALDPHDAEAHNNLGNVFLQKGRLDEAVDQFRASIEIEPGKAMAYNNLGGAYFQKKEWDEAIVQFQKAQTLDPQSDLVHYCLGLAYAKKGELDQAIAEYQKALAIMPNNILARHNLDAVMAQKSAH